jgi:branched-chain amino acid aminotransferase
MTLEPLRIAMWSGPRNISTAFMRAWGNRPDTAVCDGPLYAHTDDAIMMDTRGFVAETNATHLFLVSAGVVITSRTVACPEGITRATVLEICRFHGISCEERDVSLMEFYRADEVFCTGTMGDLVSVTQIDGRRIHSQKKSTPVMPRLIELHRELTRSSGRSSPDEKGE